jgi:hypothetical protein
MYNINEKMKSQKGAVSVLVFVTILTFVAVLTGAFATVISLQEAQLESNIRIREIYGNDVERVDEVYEELIAKRKDVDAPICTITSESIDEEKVKYTFEFNEEVKDFTKDNITIYNGTISSTSIDDETIELLETNTSKTVKFNLSDDENKDYAIYFDYKCENNDQTFNYEISGETKELTAEKEVKHEVSIINADYEETEIEFLTDMLHDDTITISNIKIIEISDEVEINNFTKSADGKKYTLTVPKESDAKQIVILEENAVYDNSGNGNEYTIEIFD